ncbi:MAG: NADH-quinone oxidoreductase subunit L, partial [Coxiellaceae bacterium]|nr:NADH-quinone oxidoreductase subunit L [Coxiellaceae bacterium]
MLVKNLSLVTLLAPLLGSLIAGWAGRFVGKRGAHWVTILLMIASFVSALMVFDLVVFQKQTFTGTIYTWGESGSFSFNVGFMIDNLTAIMMTIVTFVSMLVHLYSVGYMADDPSNQRFFSYVSLFTFAMLLLVTANNFFQLFVGWEGVGLVSYLLIGFWFKKDSANAGSLKAFFVNRVGDLGFILGIAA